MLPRCLVLLLVFVPACSGQAPGIPDPGTFLGRPLGSRWTPHARLVAYCRLVAERSPRVSLIPYGQTYEGRPLLLLAISSARNHKRMGEIRARLNQLADPRLLKPGVSLPVLVKDLPVVVWLSYNVHGNEPSPAEAALMVLHRLATGEDKQTLTWLDQAVILLDPCLNPDGRDRYVNWFRSVVGQSPSADLQSMEHDEPWPGGRFNHYLFDLNRDWAFATQVETRGRLPLFVSWKPQVHVDFHEMGVGSSYFFFPAEKPINSNLPKLTIKWGRIFGQGNARAFDARGWSYYTAESFDLFYPGYGDSWPSLTGAIGMTYEQAGHSRGGLKARRRDGTLLTLKDRLTHHATASFATIDTAVKNRVPLLLDYQAFRQTALDEGREGEPKAFLLAPAGDLGRLDALVETLRLQGIEVKRAVSAFTPRRVRDALGHEVLDRTFPPGTAVVSLAQPLKRLAKTLLEPRTAIRELYFYDISAWSLPLAYGIPVFEAASQVQAALADRWQEPASAYGLAPGAARVGYLMDYGTRGGLGALVELLARGVKLRSARKSFVMGKRAFDRGTVVIRKNENKQDLGQLLDQVGRRHRVRILPADTGWTDKGIDLGSSSLARVMLPVVALCGGPGVSSTSFGATRFLLDQVAGLPSSVLSLKDLPRLDLSRYTALVVPSGSVPHAARETLRRFVGRGGVLVAWGRGASSLMGGQGALTAIRFAKRKTEGAAAGGRKPKPRPRSIVLRRQAARKRQQPGSIFAVELDPAHPLSFGYRAEIAAFKTGTRAFDQEGPGLHVGLFAERPFLSGYVSPEGLAALKGRAYVSVERAGRGAVVLFADDPNFRGAWRGLSRLFLNAILLLPAREATSGAR